jgi:hypothetical protein
MSSWLCCACGERRDGSAVDSAPPIDAVPGPQASVAPRHEGVIDGCEQPCCNAHSFPVVEGWPQPLALPLGPGGACSHVMR